MHRIVPNDSVDLRELKRFLLRVSRASAIARVMAIVAPALFVVLVGLVTAMLIDARFPMSAIARLSISALCASVALWGAWQCIAIILPCSDDVRMRRLSRSARLCEQRLGIDDSRLINSVRLSMDPPKGVEDPIARVVHLAHACIEGERARRIVAWRPALRMSAALSAILIALLMAHSVQPRLADQVGPRFLAPYADHPPFTWTDFEFSIAPDEVTIGDDAHVRVEVRGQFPDSLRLAMTDINGQRLGSVPLSPAALGRESEARSFTTSLRSLREPVRVFAEGPTGRSRGIVITPIARPRLLSGTIISDTGEVQRLSTGVDAVNVFGVQAGATVRIQADFSIPPARVSVIDSESGSMANDVKVGAEAATATVLVRIGDSEVRSLSLRGFGATGLPAFEDLRLTLRGIEFGEHFSAGAAEMGSEAPMRMLGDLGLKSDTSAVADGASSDSASSDSDENAQSTKSTDPDQVKSAEQAYDAKSEDSGAGQGGTGSQGSAGQTPRRAVPRTEGSTNDASETDGARIAGPTVPTHVDRAGLGDQGGPRTTSASSMMAGVPEVYRDMVGRYFELIERHRRTEPRPLEED